MTETATPGPTLARLYFDAWSNHDVELALTYLADDVTGTAPNGDFAGHAGYRQFIGGFLQMLTGTSEVSVFGDDSTVVMIYRTHLQPVPTLVVAERLTVEAGRITRIEMTFDQTPLSAAFEG